MKGVWKNDENHGHHNDQAFMHHDDEVIGASIISQKLLEPGVVIKRHNIVWSMATVCKQKFGSIDKCTKINPDPRLRRNFRYQCCWRHIIQIRWSISPPLFLAAWTKPANYRVTRILSHRGRHLVLSLFLDKWFWPYSKRSFHVIKMWIVSLSFFLSDTNEFPKECPRNAIHSQIWQSNVRLLSGYHD